MKLIGMAAEYVKTFLNVVSDGNVIENQGFLEERMEKIIEKTRRFVFQQEKSSEEKDKVLYIRTAGKITSIISMRSEKSKIQEIVKRQMVSKCNCMFQSEKKEFKNEVDNIIYIETVDELQKLDKSLESLFLVCYDHKYRSYNGFCCFICILTMEGIAYIIDAIKFRSVIPTLEILGCNVKKYIHCKECVERLVEDFGDIGCYLNFEIQKKIDSYIDWRIRPINNYFTEFILDDFSEMVRKYSSDKSLEHYIPPTEKYIKKISVQDQDIAEDLVDQLSEMRDFFSKTYDESPEYVMYDKQILLLAKYQPVTVLELDRILTRISPILRLHASDFVLAIRKYKNKGKNHLPCTKKKL